MSDQLDLFSGTEFEKPDKKQKPKPQEKKEIVDATYGLTRDDIWLIGDYVKKYVSVEFMKDLLKETKPGSHSDYKVYVEIVKQVMRRRGINAKHYQIDGYGTDRLGFVKHDGVMCLKFNHRETGESIYVDI